MNARYSWSRRLLLAALAATSTASLAVAQSAPAPLEDKKADEAVKLEKFIVTGSSIKRPADEGALPISVFSKLDLEQEGIASAEQLIMNLNINGNGLDNLASNADVVAGAARGNNGATSANLRGQGSNATLILLNGRRVASHGLNGGVVDLNSIPFAAIERVEVLKDGASAVYGTDAIGGVINFITKSDFRGLVANASSDITEAGGGNIFRYSLVGGWGSLNKDGWNIMASLSLADHKMLRGDQRDFVNTFQPARGISPDTRGAPIATIFPISTLYTIISRDNLNNTGRSTGPIDPAGTIALSGGINILDLPTNTAGYAGYDGMGPYEELLWNVPSAKYASAWDTGRAAALQQPVKNTNFVSRGSYKIGEHTLTAEAVIGRSDSTKSFSPNQITSGTSSSATSISLPFLNLAYPSTGADYNRVYQALTAFFPTSVINYGQPIAFRWRAMPLGNREIRTISDTRRFLVGMEGPLPFFHDWEYRTGLAQAQSQSKSKLISGYFYAYPFAALINTGVVSPFSLTQTPEAQAALDKTRADGVQLYGGKFTNTTWDLTTSGPLWKLPAGEIQAAVGLDYRKEEYKFNGASTAYATPTDVQNYVFNAPFDNALATAGTLSRTVKAVFAELQVPIIKGVDLNVAGRRDDYTGFGSTTNPKVTLRISPTDKILIRGSYSTGFRVPTFKQQFDPSFESAYSGADLVDPTNGQPIPANSVNIISGGKPDLQPEEADMVSYGVVISPLKNITIGADWWSVNRDGTIQTLASAATLLANYQLFPDRITRVNGTITKLDMRPLNAGSTETSGIEYTGRGEFDLFGGKIVGDVNVSQLLKKRSKLIASAPWGNSEVGRFTRSSDIGLKWKYTAAVSYRKGKWTARLSQLYRAGYMDYVPPGIANGAYLAKATEYNPKVGEYITYNASLTYRWSKDITIIAGIKNLLNEDPPFSIAYDTNTGAGSSWEPRVADPRGRSFTLSVEYKLF
ncbi:MAG: TonB-dependent receptor [Candidatus Didemnitutus sp.]|nr:TonB-dependent receptor [Candidatus Didemnitutus sp.]